MVHCAELIHCENGIMCTNLCLFQAGCIACCVSRSLGFIVAFTGFGLWPLSLTVFIIDIVHIFHCFSPPCPSRAACLRCLKGSVGSCWPGINVVKSWWYGVDTSATSILFIVAPTERRSTT